jgi:CubicO group peptidase (beta-lactamase class C family)
VLENDAPIFEAYLGWSDDEGDVPTTAETSYAIASVSKTITGTSLFLADRAGAIDLDTQLNTAEDWQSFCNWFPNSSIIFAGAQLGEVTIEDFTCQGQKLRNAVNMRVNGTPGSHFLYNPIVFARLGRFIDEQGPTDIRSLVYDYVLNPASMTNTAAGWRDHQRGHVLSYLAPPFFFDGDNLNKQPFPDDDFRGAAGLYMSPLELAKFDKALSDDTLLDDDARTALWTPPTNADGNPSVYAHGWYVQEYQSETLIWHSGVEDQAYSAIYLKLPERNLTLIAMANTDRLGWGNRLDRAEIETSPVVQAFFEAFDISAQ